MRLSFRTLLRRLPGVDPGAYSLRLHLLLWLLLPQLVLWLAAALVTYSVAQRYADEAVDRQLHQASRALARQIKPLDSGLLVDFPRAAKDIIEHDPDERVFYMVSSPPGDFILGNHRLPRPPSADLLGEHPTFYDGYVNEPSGPVAVRVAAIVQNWGEPQRPQRMMVQVAKSRVGRAEVARRIVVDTAFPLTGLVLLMSTLVWIGIRSGLAPLTRLRDAVSGRRANDLAPIRLESAPQEVRALAAALNTLLAATHENMVVQRRFIGDAAHQLRTPLAGLKSQTELALRAATDPEQRRRLQLVLESATRSAHLVTQLLTLARAEPESSLAQGRSRIDVWRMACDVTAEWVPKALEAGVDLGLAEREVEPGHEGDEPAPHWVIGNPLLLREALVNLIDNAIRYGGSGTEVTVDVCRQGADVQVSVVDDGRGMDAAFLPRAFERFARGETTGSGCGLGLAIVKEIVERHGGRVMLQARDPHGLHVALYLPAA